MIIIITVVPGYNAVFGRKNKLSSSVLALVRGLIIMLKIKIVAISPLKVGSYINNVSTSSLHQVEGDVRNLHNLKLV